MHKRQTVLDALLQQRLLPLFYHDDADKCLRILHALFDAGIRLVEYVDRGPNAPENFKRMLREASASMPGLLLGIGTIKNVRQAMAYTEAGADFIVCPTTSAAVGQAVMNAGLLWIPGCMTPTDIAEAESAGATLVKIFPGNVVGPAFISAVKDLFPRMRFMPTGGVDTTKENLAAWFNAGVSAVGMGSKLISDTLIRNEDYNGIKTAVAQAMVVLETISRK